MPQLIHTKLKQARISKGVTIRQLAEAMKLKSKSGKTNWYLIQKIESGGNVNYRSYVRYAAALGLTIETILKEA